MLEIDRLCESCDVWFLSMRELSDAEPDFNMVPQIQPIPWHTAVMELLRGLQNELRSAPVQAFLELAEMLEGVECYRLSVGKLDEMGDHICNLMLN